MTDQQLSLLVVEDDDQDAWWLEEHLAETNDIRFELQRTTSLAGTTAALTATVPDVILLDLCLPDSQGFATFQAVHNINAGCPIIVLTGTGDGELGARAVKHGAQDFLIKGDCSFKLLQRAIVYAVERARLLRQLQAALDSVQTLRGLIPICCKCKRVRDDDGYWQQVEEYLQARSAAEFTHGFCPFCSAAELAIMRHSKARN